MPNKIQIKHGEGYPSKEQLDEAELGFDTLNKSLYIGINGEQEHFLINKINEIGEEYSENLTSEIKTLFLDNQKNKALYPRTRVEAIKDNKGNELASLLDLKQKQHLTLTVTLFATSWRNNKQTVSATGVSEKNTVIVCSAPENTVDYTSDGVYCLGQSEGKLTFACVSTPKTNLVANVMILN